MVVVILKLVNFKKKSDLKIVGKVIIKNIEFDNNNK